MANFSFKEYCEELPLFKQHVCAVEDAMLFHRAWAAFLFQPVGGPLLASGLSPGYLNDILSAGIQWEGGPSVSTRMLAKILGTQTGYYFASRTFERV